MFCNVTKPFIKSKAKLTGRYHQLNPRIIQATVSLYTPDPKPGDISSMHGYGEVVIAAAAGDGFRQLRAAFDRGEWLLGYLGYDLKNEVEKLTSRHPNRLGFPDMMFIRPEYLEITRDGKEEVLVGEQVDVFLRPPRLHRPLSEFKVMPFESYREKLRQLREHLRVGDIYEANYCIEFQAEGHIHPTHTFLSLLRDARAPFSAYVEYGDKYLMCASPERFLRKEGNRLISQPIKGTARRGSNAAEDAALKAQLGESLKDRAENVMIVDLVRNDLARSAVTGSTKVTELFGVHSYPYVHQMISTIEAELAPRVHPIDALRHAFPMGSMTGAPKIRAMQIIDELETFRRGVFSGAVGYITPDGDFDFNVVIRSILYNESRAQVSVPVGGAITWDSDPAAEYEECMIKAGAMMDAMVSVDR